MSYNLFNIVLYAWISLAVITFFSLFFVPAPYGRFIRNNWGPGIPNWLGWVIMELPSPLLLSYFIITGEGQKNTVIWFLMALWIAHYIDRTFIDPFRITSRNKRMPISVALMGLFFNFGNGFFNGYYLGNYAGSIHHYSFTDIIFLLGLILFIIGVIINLQSDSILINLRKNTADGYAIPGGGMFKYISSPNYFGELIEWLGFAIMTAGLPAFSFFIWTFANLVPRAIDNHKWYKKTFQDYPPERKAIFPFLL
jgi:3-oxo-5-alpha-steroid 4-dehydrogenase 1